MSYLTVLLFSILVASYPEGFIIYKYKSIWVSYKYLLDNFNLVRLNNAKKYEIYK